MAAKTVLPCLPKSDFSLLFRLSAIILPNAMTQAPGKIIMEYSSTRLEIIVGFSNGVDELAPKKPPPFVPTCFDSLKCAIGPATNVLPFTFQRRNRKIRVEILGVPCQIRSIPAIKAFWVICQELFEEDFDMFFRKRVTLTDLRYILRITECQFDSILYSVSSFSPVYSWF